MNINLNNEYWRAAFFSKFNTLIHDIICVKTFYSESIKNYSGAAKMRKCLWDMNVTNNPINFVKVQRKGIENFLTCALKFLFPPPLN